MAVKEIFNAVLNYKKGQLADMVKAELDEGTDISRILNDGLIAAMEVVGKISVQVKSLFQKCSRRPRL